MNTFNLLSGLAVLGGIAICMAGLAWLYRPYWIRSPAPLDDSDELGERLRRHAERARQRSAVRLLLPGAFVFLLGIVLLVAAPRSAQHGRQELPPPIAVERTTPAPQPLTATTLWPLMAGGSAAIAIGAILMLFASGRATRIVGAATILSGLAANGYLVGKVKIDDLVKFDIKVDKPTLDLGTKLKQVRGAEFGPQQLGVLDGFVSGQSVVPGQMEDRLKSICERWQQAGAQAQKGLLLIVGSTDRVRLNSNARRQFESNVGLAQARAEQVRAALEQCGVAHNHMLTLVSGPRHTPEVGKTTGEIDVSGKPGDRSVAVYALWNQRLSVE